MEIYKYILYIHPIKEANIKYKKVIYLQEIILLINKISPNKFIEGGLAILLIINKNQNKHILGIIVNIPLLIKIFRDIVRSYTIFAKQNIPDEHNP